MIALNSSAKVLKLDFHLHTIDDPEDQHIRHTPQELIDKAALLGYDVLAITLHNKQLWENSILAYAKSKGILLLPGVEREIEGSHVLLINFKAEEVIAIKSFADLARFKNENNLVIAAHPYYPNSVCLQDDLLKHWNLFDAVECSGFFHKLWNPNHKTLTIANERGKPIIGNSDTHTLEQFGTIWTEVVAEPNAEAIVQALKTGKGIVKSRPLKSFEMLKIGVKVIGYGYCKWINYKRSRRYLLPAE